MARIPRIPFHFHAEGHALSGEIHEPVWYPIPAKASVSLATIGGQAEAHHEFFSAHEFLSFQRAFTHVAGRRVAKDTFVTHMTTSIIGLDIEGILKADRITCRLTSTHDPKHPEGVILSNGSAFENLRILGHRVDVFLRHKLLSEFDTFDKFRKRVETEKKSGKIAKFTPEVAVCTLVERIESDLPFIPKDVGYIFEVPNFGQVTVAEIFAEKGTRTLTMLHLELGSPQTANLTVGEGRTNGQPPPTP